MTEEQDGTKGRDYGRAPSVTSLVTGASSGIGMAFARRLAARGDDLVIVARSEGKLKELADEIQSGLGREVEVLAADLTLADDVGRVEQRLQSDDRPVELLVNNAGFGTAGKFVELPVGREDEEIRLNVLALMRLTHAALPGMLRRGHGGVINAYVASFVGIGSDMFFRPAHTAVNVVLAGTNGVRALRSLGDVNHLQHDADQLVTY